jgi:hypothetical protein
MNIYIITYPINIKFPLLCFLFPLLSFCGDTFQISQEFLYDLLQILSGFRNNLWLLLHLVLAVRGLSNLLCSELLFSKLNQQIVAHLQDVQNASGVIRKILIQSSCKIIVDARFFCFSISLCIVSKQYHHTKKLLFIFYVLFETFNQKE